MSLYASYGLTLQFRYSVANVGDFEAQNGVPPLVPSLRILHALLALHVAEGSDHQTRHVRSPDLMQEHL